MKYKGLATRSVHAGTIIASDYPGANTPIHTSTSYRVDFDKEDYTPYPRYLNTPNHNAVANKLAALENAKYAYITSSGMAAITSAILACVQVGDHAIFQKEIYGGTYNFVERVLDKYGISSSWIAIDEMDKLESLVTNKTKLLFLETPSNPLLKIVDIKACVDFARKHKLITIADNTFATPINQNPLDMSVDIVVHSASKYLSGHSDMLCGAVLSNSKELAHNIFDHLFNHGPTLDPVALYTLERSIKTLALRMERHNSNGMKLAEYLSKHPKVTKVNYPGLITHPRHELAVKQMRGFSGMLSFEIDGDLSKAKTFISKLQIICSGLSLAGVESLISIPRLSSHYRMTNQERKDAGVADNLIRLSVGIEDHQDLIEDLEQALTSL